MNFIKRNLHNFYVTFISLKGPPEQIARSFSLGFWIAWFPIIGTHWLLSLVGGMMFRANMPAVYLGSWLFNPLTMAPMLFIDYLIGTFMLNKPFIAYTDFIRLIDAFSLAQFFRLGLNLIGPLLVGGLLLGTLNAILGYYPVKIWVIRVRRRQAENAAKKEQP